MEYSIPCFWRCVGIVFQLWQNTITNVYIASCLAKALDLHAHPLFALCSLLLIVFPFDFWNFIMTDKLRVFIHYYIIRMIMRGWGYFKCFTFSYLHYTWCHTFETSFLCAVFESPHLRLFLLCIPSTQNYCKWQIRFLF